MTKKELLDKIAAMPGDDNTQVLTHPIDESAEGGLEKLWGNNFSSLESVFTHVDHNDEGQLLIILGRSTAFSL